MGKYKKDDKVVIRKDLIVDEFYNGLYWCDEKEYMKELDYVVIEEVNYGDYLVKDEYWLTEEMIEGLYK